LILQHRVRNERSLEKLSDADLHRLVELARLWQQDLERRKPHWRLYEGRLLRVCLAQGAALHLIDGTNGIKDFDVYRFFAASPERPNPDPAIYRGRTHVDFGESRFGPRVDPGGRRPFPHFVGRNVDIFSAVLPVTPDSDPVTAIPEWRQSPRTTRQRALAKKAIVIIDPRPLRIAWPPLPPETELRGYLGVAN
jgi:hypothetical protein